MYIENHPILGRSEPSETVNITVDGVPMQVRAGQMIAAALLAEGIAINRYTLKKHEPRGVFCGIGQCTDCVMVVNGQPNTRTCVTKVEEGMVIETQNKDLRE
ncbi:MAG: (2Fe-2S)-binding protein [Clostridiales bacterium]|nr:(2Fe-2S)-binding protein [Clostridiales bacterium]